MWPRRFSVTQAHEGSSNSSARRALTSLEAPPARAARTTGPEALDAAREDADRAPSGTRMRRYRGRACAAPNELDAPGRRAARSRGVGPVVRAGKAQFRSIPFD